MGTRYVNVSLPHKREATVPNKDVVVPLDCKSIFVKNLPYEADEDSVKGVFMRFGKISSVRIPRHMDRTSEGNLLCRILEWSECKASRSHEWNSGNAREKTDD